MANVGKTADLTVKISPANAENQTVSRSNGNASFEKVSSKGVVTGVAIGTATITAKTTDGGLTASCAVTVVESLGLKVNAPKMYVGGALVTCTKSVIVSGKTYVHSRTFESLGGTVVWNASTKKVTIKLGAKT